MNRQKFEDVIRRDVRNNPIVREVDQKWVRELRRWGVIGVIGAAVVLVSAWQHFELLRHGYRIEQLQQEHVRELEINRHLRLEIETLRAPARIERIATRRLNLVAPGSGEAIVIERVAPAARPDPSIVATRREETVDEAAGRP